jgi:arginine/lysine/ornithine decarboxylase
MATCPPGSTLLLARNCHLSAFNAAVLAGCHTAWVALEADEQHGVAHCVAPRALAAALQAQAAAGARVGAVLVVSPTYFGAVARVAGGREEAGWTPGGSE